MKRHIGKEINNISHDIFKQLTILAKETGLSGAQGRILHYILTNDDRDLYQKDIEEAYHLRPASATELLKKLENEGYIKRVPCEHDKRLKKIVCLQDQIDQQNIKDHLDDFEDHLREGLTDEEVNQLFVLLDKLSKNL